MADQLLFLTRWGLYATLAPLFGIPAFRLIGLRSAGFGVPQASAMVVLGIAALLLSALQLVCLAAVMGGVPLSVVDGPALVMLLGCGPMGTAWMLRVAALAAGVLLAAGLRRRPDLAVAPLAATGAVALCGFAWCGHGAADAGAAGWLHLAADLAHLLAAGLWTGALLVFIHALARDPATVDRTHLAACAEMLTGFAAIGTAIVAVLIVTGVANGVFLFGDPRAVLRLADDPYGRMLLLKLAAFAVMLGLAASNRWRLTPALARAVDGADMAAAFRRLRRSIAIETLALLMVFALVARLGMLPPTGAA